MAKTAIIMFGRFNPPTRGHEELFHFALKMGKQKNADVILFVSSTQNDENPLTYREKVQYIHQSVPKLWIGPKKVNNPAATLTWAQAHDYQNVFFLIGQDRAKTFQRMIHSWSKAQDPDGHMTVSLKVTPRHIDTVSGTIARQLAQRGELNQFKKLLISGLQDNTSATEIMQKIQNRLGVVEEQVMRIKTFEDWLKEADPVGKDDAASKEKKPSTDKEKPEPVPDEEPTPEPPPPPLPIDSTEDDGRVPSDTPENQSKLVIHPPTKLKTNMKKKVNDIRAWGAKY